MPLHTSRGRMEARSDPEAWLLTHAVSSWLVTLWVPEEPAGWEKGWVGGAALSVWRARERETRIWF